MGRKKGDGLGRFGGRQKGSTNKVTNDLKEWISGLIDQNRGTLEKDLKGLEPNQRLIIMERLMQYVVPKQQSVSVEAQIQAEYSELEKLLEKAPEEVLDKLLARIEKIKTDGE